MSLFTGFFDEYSHLGVRRFQVDRPIVMVAALAACNTMTQRYLVLKGSMQKLSTHIAWATGTRWVLVGLAFPDATAWTRLSVSAA